jgi:hypothetical protein
MTHAIISKEIRALDIIIDGASELALEAFAKKADLKQGKLASEASGRVINAVKARLDGRLNQNRLIEIEAKLIEAQEKAPT